jgi:hypothetical protein
MQNTSSGQDNKGTNKQGQDERGREKSRQLAGQLITWIQYSQEDKGNRGPLTNREQNMKWTRGIKCY